MMIHQGMQIRIAVIGYVSDGKSTVLNALFGNAYTETGRGRTTNVINSYALLPSGSTITPRSAASTLSESKQDNDALRRKNKVVEKLFDIQLDKDLFDMSNNVTYIFTEYPGTNEAEADNIYKTCIAENWMKFDCCVVVMDSGRGVNTDEQVALLKFVKDNLAHKDIPVIILGNKFDPTDNELARLSKEIQRKIETIFGVGCRSAALEELVTAMEQGRRCDNHVFPVYIPVSARCAYIYRAASCVDQVGVKAFDDDILNVIGLEAIGAKWRRLPPERKYQVAFDYIQDDQQRSEGLKASNFDKFISVLAYAVGGKEAQSTIFDKQIQVAIQQLEQDDDCILAEQIAVIHRISKSLGKSTSDLNTKFWSRYESKAAKAYAAFSNSMDRNGLHDLMTQLAKFKDLCISLEWTDDKIKATEEAESIVRRAFGILFQKEMEWRWNQCSLACGAVVAEPNWKSISPHDWASIWVSILYVTRINSHCNERFGGQLLKIEMLHGKYIEISNGMSTWTSYGHMCVNGEHLRDFSKLREAFTGTYTDGIFTPSFPTLYQQAVQIEIPRSFANPQHWGHLMWSYGNYLRSLDIPMD